MLAVVKTPRTKLRIEGYISRPVLKILRTEYGKALKVKTDEDDESLVDFFETDIFKEFKQRMKPGDYVKAYRENLSITQAALGVKIGMPRAYICDVEHGRRAIGKENAKKLATIFKISVSHLI
jgi:antitoxin component HigA of HigAB toxin-antitoxin module